MKLERRSKDQVFPPRYWGDHAARVPQEMIEKAFKDTVDKHWGTLVALSKK